jgi:predicted ATP-grasp superfamily ATP-dependent carboligase
MNQPARILIVGASARAAAFSALRAGLVPRCIDYFADYDLMSMCATQRAEARKGAVDLERLAIGLPPQRWLYTGPLENHAGRVERISSTHHLCGNSPEILRAARNPFRLVDLLREEGLPYLETRSDASGLPRDGRWLVKPRSSAGGRLIQKLDNATRLPAEPTYFQRFLDGPSHSALFLARESSAELVGVTRQLLGKPGSPFAYQGSIGPCTISEPLRSRLYQIGNVLSRASRLVGLFGVDYIEHDGEPWLVEINPRYTASVEVFELATHRTLLTDHLLACGMQPPEPLSAGKPKADTAKAPVVGKAILYAQRNLMAPNVKIDDPRSRDLFAVHAIADVPWPGTPIAAGQPIMTVYTTGQDAQECYERLVELETFWNKNMKI